MSTVEATTPDGDGQLKSSNYSAWTHKVPPDGLLCTYRVSHVKNFDRMQNMKFTVKPDNNRLFGDIEYVALFHARAFS
jgi:hypothetical protein